MNQIDLSPLRHWQEGDIHYAENSFIRIAWVYTTDPELDGTMGWHGPDQIYVEYKLRKGLSKV